MVNKKIIGLIVGIICLLGCCLFVFVTFFAGIFFVDDSLRGNSLESNTILNDVEAFDFTPDFNGIVAVQYKYDSVNSISRLYYYALDTKTLTQIDIVSGSAGNSPILFSTNDGEVYWCPNSEIESCNVYKVDGRGLKYSSTLNDSTYNLYNMNQGGMLRNPVISDPGYFGWGVSGHFGDGVVYEDDGLEIKNRLEYAIDLPDRYTDVYWNGNKYSGGFGSGSQSGYFIGSDGILYLLIKNNLVAIYN